MSSKQELEDSKFFQPQFNHDGLIPVIAQDETSGEILMMAYMNQEALDLTMQTGNAVYYSRSRRKLWKKGEQSGHMQEVIKILVDCDQDCVVLKVRVKQGQCHTGHQSCFYRAVANGRSDTLDFIATKVFDPDKAYG